MSRPVCTILLASAFFCGGCPGDPPSKQPGAGSATPIHPQVSAAELVGPKWRATGNLSGPQGRNMSWMKEFTFRSDGTFLMTGYPPIEVTGRWKVESRAGRKMTISFVERKMGTNSWPDDRAEIELGTDGQNFVWKEDRYERQLAGE